MKNVLILVFLTITLAGCSSKRFQPYTEPAHVCVDLSRDADCIKTINDVDNTIFFKHDYREIQGIKVPQ